MSPLLDVLITLLQWGADGWQQVLRQREEVYRWATLLQATPYCMFTQGGNAMMSSKTHGTPQNNE